MTGAEEAERRIRYVVAASLDGYIAGPRGEADWIVRDADFDFGALFAQFDTAFIGRRTFEMMARENKARMPGIRSFVFSRTLRQLDHPDVTIVSDRLEETVADLRAHPGKDIWLFGGGMLFRSFADAGLVDSVEVAVIPVLLGEGLQLVAPPAKRANLRLTGHSVFKTGIVLLEYGVVYT